MSGLCLAAAGAIVARFTGVAAFTLAWSHSVEKTRWEEDWRVEPAGLVVVEARVEGHGAGMEPPPGARRDGRFWRWAPQVPPQREVVLRRSGATADWQICLAGDCRDLGSLVPAEADPVVLSACD